VLYDRSRFRDHRLTQAERHDWRFMLTLVGAALLILAYLLPFFDARIAAARTRIEDEQEITLQFPTLVHGQHAAQAKALRNGSLISVNLDVEQLPATESTGVAWLLRAATAPDASAHVSFVISMFVPLVAAALALGLVLRSWARDEGIAEYLLPASLNAALAGLLGLLLAWGHQIDFSTYLAGLAGGALTPSWGYWVALGAAAMMMGGLWSLRYETQRSLMNWWALTLVVALAVWLLVRARPYPYLEIWNFISDGIVVTLRIVVTSYGFILLVSLLGGLGRISHNRVIYAISSLYVEIIRGIPLLVQLLFIWFALPNLFRTLGDAALGLPPGMAGLGQWLSNLRLNEYTAAVMGLTICYGAYGAEIFRAGISSIHHGQMEAARSLGMSSFQAMRYVILPQAIQRVLPPLGNDFVAMLKDSSLVSVLGVRDITMLGKVYSTSTFRFFETYNVVAFLYLSMTIILSLGVRYMEKRMAVER